jgi:hypothetical protein
MALDGGIFLLLAGEEALEVLGILAPWGYLACQACLSSHSIGGLLTLSFFLPTSRARLFGHSRFSLQG